MDPTLLLQAPGFLSGLMSLFGAGEQRDPVHEMGRAFDMLQNRFGPGAIASQGNEMYRHLVGSPMFSAAMRNLAVGGQQSENLLTRNLAGAGIAGSGVGQIRRAMAPSVMASGASNLKSRTYGMGMDAVMQMMQNIMRTGGAMPGRAPSGMGALNFARGIEGTNWGPIMDWFMRGRVPQTHISPPQNRYRIENTPLPNPYGG